MSDLPHLSVLALAFDASQRSMVEAAARAATGTSATLLRAAMVRAAAGALRALEPGWYAFGYGEKDLPHLPATEQSYRHAFEDFAARGNAAASADGTLAVATLVIATRSHLVGVSRLDDAAQVRAALDERLSLDATGLLGAELVWAPPGGAMTPDTLSRIFPEMQLLSIT